MLSEDRVKSKKEMNKHEWTRRRILGKYERNETYLILFVAS